MVKSGFLLIVGMIVISLTLLIFNLQGFRVLLGIIFVLFLPGYVLMQTLFPKGDLDWTEKVILTIVLSVSVVIIDGLILDRFWDLSFIPIIASLSLFILVFALISAILRIRFS
ncbi:MAG: DUF1616 domain-containing protein [Candidatus Methanofastidiosia archaeon]